MKSDLIMAVNQICAEKELPRAVILKAIEDALVSAYRRNYASNNAVVQVTIDAEDGDLHIYCEQTAIHDLHATHIEIRLDESRNLDPASAVGCNWSNKRVPKDFGR